MDKALVGNRTYSAAAYARLSNEERSRHSPVCLECRDVVHAYGLFSTTVKPRFDHPDALQELDPLDDCSLANRSDRLRQFGKDAMDRARGRRVRATFFEPENIARAYAFCLGCTGRSALPLRKFELMLSRADRLDIWSYVGIQIWAIPHILLLLADFRTGRGIDFHFALERAPRLSAIWRRADPVCSVKLFTGSGTPFEYMGGGPNPRPIIKDDYDRTDIGSVGTGVIRTLRSYEDKSGRRTRSQTR